MLKLSCLTVASQLYTLLWKNALSTFRRVFFVEVSLILLSCLFLCLFLVNNPVRFGGIHPEFKHVSVVEEYKKLRGSNTLAVAYAPDSVTSKAIVKELQSHLMAKENIEVSLKGFLTEDDLSVSATMGWLKSGVALVFRNFPPTPQFPVEVNDTSGNNTNNHRNNSQACVYSGNCNGTWAQSFVREKISVIIRPILTVQSAMRWRPNTMLPTESAYCADNAVKDYTSTGTNLLLQFTVEAIIKFYTQDRPKIRLYTQGIQCDQSSEMKSQLQIIISVIVVILSLPVVLVMTEVVAEENQALIPERLKTLGVSRSVQGLSWTLCAILVSVILGSLLTILLRMPEPIATLPNSSHSVLIAFFTLFILTNLCLAFWVAELQMTGTTPQAILLGILTLGILQAAYVHVYREQLTKKQLWLFGLSSSSSLESGVSLIVRYEQTGDGIRWGNIGSPPDHPQTFHLFEHIFLLICNTLFNLFLWIVISHRRNIWLILPGFMQKQSDNEDMDCIDFGRFIRATNRYEHLPTDASDTEDVFLQFNNVTEVFIKFDRSLCHSV